MWPGDISFGLGSEPLCVLMWYFHRPEGSGLEGLTAWQSSFYGHRSLFLPCAKFGGRERARGLGGERRGFGERVEHSPRGVMESPTGPAFPQHEEPIGLWLTRLPFPWSPSSQEHCLGPP